MNDLDLSDVDERCRICEHVIYPFRAIYKRKPKWVTCRLSIKKFDPFDCPEDRGFCGLADPDKCNNGTKTY